MNDGISGIYKIKNVHDGRSYIGSAINIADCWMQHRSDFANGVNERKLQTAWDKFGPVAFVWVLLETVDKEIDLPKRLDFHLATLTSRDLNDLAALPAVAIKAKSNVIHLREIKEEDHPERLIEIIQNKSGRISKEEREGAMIMLIRRFQYLIRKITNSLYYNYELQKKYNWDIKDFRQDVFTEFIDLVMHDFKIKEDINDTGLAVFGNYIKVKLYRRVQFNLQKMLKKQGFQTDITTDYDSIVSFDPTGAVMKLPMYNEIREAIVANALNYDELVMQHMSDEKCEAILKEIISLSHQVLDARERDVWERYYLSGETVGEIGQHILSMVDEGKGIGRSRVLQIAREANDRILREYGRRAGIQKAAL